MPVSLPVPDQRGTVAADDPRLVWLYRLARHEGIALDHPHGPVQALRLALTGRLAHPAAAWRFVCRHGREAFRAVAAHPHVSHRFHAVGALAEGYVAIGLDAPLPRALGHRLVQDKYLYHDQMIQIAPSLLTAYGAVLPALVRSLRQRPRPVTPGLMGEFIDVAYWLIWGRPKLDHNAPRTNWARFVGRARAWHQRQRLAAAGDWDYDAPVERVGAFEVVALNNPLALWEEGQAMRHCLFYLADLAADGRSRFFGLRRGGRRVASVELQWSSTGAFVRDVRRACNRLPDAEILAAAQELARAADRATCEELRRAA